MTDMEKGLIRMLNDNNIPTRQMVSILSYLRGGPTALPMKKKDISNFRTKINREIKASDMTKVLDYFRKRQTKDPSFFYKLDLDEERRRKCYNRNTKVFSQHEGLYEDFEDIINNSLTIEEFETLWVKMIEDKNLQNNKYMTKMWQTRHRFIPVYFKHDFFPFIQTTSRSESMNSRMKDNVGPTYSMMGFIREYNRVIETINKNERLEESYSNQKIPKEFIFGYTIEQQAAELYNRNIFRKFQVQLKATARLSYKETEKGKTFEVWPKSNQIHNVHRIKRYTVQTDLIEGNEEFSCICAKFSKDRILCSHILKVIIEKEISTIPEKYIKDGWRKKSTRVHVRREQEETIATSALLRFNVLSRKSAILNSKGLKTKKSMEYLLSKFSKLDVKLDVLFGT
ncbi:protein FAR1-RELATED SEQUENCE 5-like [Miscanthus floridulus]|uniref:protein FAR1-RELATED SEQUENCE 5-like n=1 Tax=Miscanthus floridulus TaxID=154761 RepID=UPI0034586CD8